jgi:hypothetical protein
LLQQTQSFRAIATRYDILNFLAGVHLASAVILINGKQAVVERLLPDRIWNGDHVAILLARSTVVKATASTPGRI